MKQTINSVLKEVLEKAQPPREDVELIGNSLKSFLEKFEKSLKKLKIGAEVFVGGSYAKKTMIKKDNYDIDVFVRFLNSKDNISKLTKKALGGMSGVKMVHGSRDYFQVTITKDVFLEVIPVVKVTKPSEAKNITDLSYSHVMYVNRKIREKSVLDDIKLAKVFCYASNCYGAESYIHGFSGYALELLVAHYGSFLKFIRAMAKSGGHPRVYPETVSDETSTRGKIVIDIEKHYKNKLQVMMDINGSKLNSPIILVDPTYKQRNVAAALSEETFLKFQKACVAFLKSPSVKFFELQKIDFEKLREGAKKLGLEFVELEVKTNRQAGDIAGSKLLKFHKHLLGEIARFFQVKKEGFEYSGKKISRGFFVVKSRGEILQEGPSITDLKNVKKFKKEHPKAFVKNHRAYAKEKINFSVESFLKKWATKNSKRMKEMAVVGMELGK